MRTAQRRFTAMVVGLAMAGTAGVLPEAAASEEAGPPPGLSRALQLDRPDAPPQAGAALAKLPLRFEPNRGQADPEVRFLARGRGYTLFLTASEAVFALAAPSPSQPGATGPDGAGQVVRMKLAGSNATAAVVGDKRQTGKTNYLIGNDPGRWQRDVPGYAGVRYRGVYPGIDLLFYGTKDGALEYDFEIAPKADPSTIGVAFEGAKPTLEAGGDVVLRAGAAELRQHKPVLYQRSGAGRRPVTGAFSLRPDGALGFSVGAYDRRKPLVIDPVLTYSTYLGGSTPAESMAFASGVATDPNAANVGDVYLTGTTLQTNFPTSAGTYDTSANGRHDRFVTKLNTDATGATSLVWSTYLGGSLSDDSVSDPAAADGGGIAVNAAGYVYVTGRTISSDFPVTTTGVVGADTGCGTAANCNATPNTYTDGSVDTVFTTQLASATAKFDDDDIGTVVSGSNFAPGTTLTGWSNGGTLGFLSTAATAGTNLTFTLSARNPRDDAFLTKLAPLGNSLAYSTYLGGGGEDSGRSVAVVPGSADQVVVAGSTQSSDLPAGTSASYDDICGTDDVCNPTDSTFSDGTVAGSTLTSAGASFTSADVGKIVNGGGGGFSILTVTNARTVTLSGSPTPGSGLSFTVVGRLPAADAFVAKFDTAVSGVNSRIYASYLGTAGADNAHGLALGSTGLAYLTGTASPGLATPGGYQATAVSPDGFLVKLDVGAGTAGLQYGTYLGGGNGRSVAVDGAANAYLTGSTGSTTFPVKAPVGFSPAQSTRSGGGDAFVTKVNTGDTGANSLIYSTYLGGSDVNAESGNGIALDNANPPNATVVGSTPSSDFPQVRQFQLFGGGVTDGFVSQVNATGSALVYSSHISGSGADVVTAVAIDTSNSPYLVGETVSANFSTTSGAYQPAFQGTSPFSSNAFVTRLNITQDGALISSSSPRGGPTTGGTTVTISGAGFTGVTKVTFGITDVTTTPCPAQPTSAGCYNVDSSSQITAVSPACAGCTDANIKVTTTLSPSGSNGSRFVYGEGLPAPGAACSTAACGGTMVALADGRVLAVNGSNPTQVFNPATGAWTASGACQTLGGFTDAATLTLLPNGKVLVAGGETASHSSDGSARASLYDPAGNGGIGTCSATNPMSQARSHHTATLLKNGLVLVTGGCFTDCYSLGEEGLASAELFNPADNTWASVPTNIPGGGRFDHTATLLDGPACTTASPAPHCGKVLLAGGGLIIGASVFFDEASDRSQLYNPTTNAWEAAGGGGNPGGKMKSRRMGHVASLLNGPACTKGGTVPAWCGKVLLAGGSVDVGGASATATAELYDPAASANQRFAVTGSMASARDRFSAVLLPNGRVLAIGNAFSGNADVAERYDPAAGTWTSAGGLNRDPAIGSKSAVLLPSGPASACGTLCGKVLINELETIGGVDFHATDMYSSRPVVNAVVPNADCNVGGAAVTITGTGLTSVGRVTFGTVNALRLVPDQANPDTKVVAVAPAGTTGTVSIKVFSQGGESDTALTTDDLAYSATLPSSKPCAPGNVTASARNGAASVSWAVPSIGPAPTNYRVAAKAPLAAFDDGVTIAGSSTFYSASASFRPADVGKAISGTNIPAGATVASVADATKITLSGTAPSISGVGLAFSVNRLGYLAPAPVTVGAVTTTTLSGLTNSLTSASRLGYSLVVTPLNGAAEGSPAMTTLVFPQETDGTFVPLTPARILDTRGGINTGTCYDDGGTPLTCTTLAPNQPKQVQVTGAGGVPASGVTAVVMNVTAVGPSTNSFLTVWPADATKPNASNLNYDAGAIVPNLVTVKLSPNGRVKIDDTTATVDVIVDVAGYYVDANANAASRYNALTPARILDSRATINTGTCYDDGGTPLTCTTLAPNQPKQLQVTGKGGVPASGVTAVVMNVTAVGPSTNSFLTVWPADASKPNASNLNYNAGAIVPNLVTVKLSPNGRVKIDDTTAAVDVIVDVAGWYAENGSLTGSRFTALTPARILDSRSGINTGTCYDDGGTPVTCTTLAPNQPKQLQVTGAGGVPASGVAGTVMNVTAVSPSTNSFLTVWPADATKPNASNLNYAAGQIIPNLVAVKLSPNGRVKLDDTTAAVDVIVDVAGWFNDGGS